MVSQAMFKLQPSNLPKDSIYAKLGTVPISLFPIGVQLGTIKMAVDYDGGIHLSTVSAFNVALYQGNNQIERSGAFGVQINDLASLAKIVMRFLD